MVLSVKNPPSQPGEFQVEKQLVLMHSDECPCFKLAKMASQPSTPFKLNLAPRNLQLASCGIIVDCNKKVLITKRNRNLKTFPSCWVFPGGRLDLCYKEDFQTAVLREIEEEVGLVFALCKGAGGYGADTPAKEKSQFPKGALVLQHISPLILYESSFPNRIEMGFPQYQTLIQFYVLQLVDKAESIQLTLQEEEVEAAAWV